MMLTYYVYFWPGIGAHVGGVAAGMAQGMALQRVNYYLLRVISTHANTSIEAVVTKQLYLLEALSNIHIFCPLPLI